jgi:hypothetical protein
LLLAAWGTVELVESGIAEELGLNLTVGAGSPAMRVINVSHWAAFKSPLTTTGEGVV